MYEIITHGGGDLLWKCLNAIAMLSKDGEQGLLGVFLILSFYISGVACATALVLNQDFFKLGKQLSIAFFMLAVMLLPSSRVLVTDNVTHFNRPVDNVPWLLAAVASVASNIGYGLAANFDLVFRDANYPEYTKTGMVMYSDLINKLSEARLPSTTQTDDIKNFISHCVVYDLALGKYSLEALMNNNNPIEFIKVNTSTNRGVIVRNEGRASFMACSRVLDTVFLGNQYLNNYANNFSRVFFSGYADRHEDLGRLLISHIGSAYGYLSKAGNDAEQILKTNMLRNVIRDWRADKSHDVAMAYAVAHAEQNQSFSFKSMGKMAGTLLPIMKIIIEVLTFSLFPIVAILSVLPSGLTILKKYVGLFFWVQLWPVFFAVLNMVFTSYAQHKGHALTAEGLTLGNIGALAELNDSISAYAGYAMSLIPFLSLMVVKGADAFVQLSTSMAGVTQSAVGSAAHEAAAGTYKVNDVGVHNRSHHNESGFKYDENMIYQKNKDSWQMQSGAIQHNMPDGTPVLDTTPTMSRLGTDFSSNEGLSLGFSQMADESQKQGMTLMQSSQKHLTSALSTFQGIQENRRNGKDATNTWVQGDSVNNSSGLSTLYSAGRDLSKELGISLEQGNDLAVSLGINGNKSTGISIPISGNSSHKETTSNSERQRIAESIAQRYNLQQAISKAHNEAKDGRYAMVDAEGHQYDSGIKADLHKSQSLQESAQQSFAEERAYRKSAQIAHNSGVQVSENLNQQMYEWGVGKYGQTEFNKLMSTPEGSAKLRQHFINSHTPAMQQQFDASSTYHRSNELRDTYEDGKQKMIAGNYIESEYEKNKTEVVTQSSNKGLTTPVQSDIPEKVEASHRQTDTLLAEKYTEHETKKTKMEAEHQTFKEKNVVNDYSTMIKDGFNSHLQERAEFAKSGGILGTNKDDKHDKK